jgi:hypothetical protein
MIDADSVIADLGRAQRLFTAKGRKAAQLLVTTCTHRDCDIPSTLFDVDHRRDGPRWGPTDQANAMPLCGSHDRWKYANKTRSRRANSGPLFLIRHDGTTVLPVGGCEPDWAESPSPEPHAEQPSSIDILWEQVGVTVDFDDPTSTIRPDRSVIAEKSGGVRFGSTQ